MPAVTRIVSSALRVAEIVFAIVVASLIGIQLHGSAKRNDWGMKRFIYTEAIAAVSVILGLIWLLPFAGCIFGWPLDLILTAAWFAAFALLFDLLHDNCGNTFNSTGVTDIGMCRRQSAIEVFSFLSALLWLISAIIGVWIFAKARKERAVAAKDVNNNRRRWYRGPRV